MAWALRIKKCDNRLRVIVNGETIWEEYKDFNPDLNIVIDLDPFLTEAENRLKVLGFNGPTVRVGQDNPWEFYFVLEHDREPTATTHEAGPSDGLPYEVLKVERAYIITEAGLRAAYATQRRWTRALARARMGSADGGSAPSGTPIIIALGGNADTRQSRAATAGTELLSGASKE